MKKLTIYHNPRCSKSREALALIREQGIEPTVIDYLKNPPTISDIKNILKKLGVKPIKMMRLKESIFSELDLHNATDTQLIKAMSEHPALIERPIVVNSEKAIIARPPTNILTVI